MPTIEEPLKKKLPVASFLGSSIKWLARFIEPAEGLFDRIFIDWFWVGKTKAWIIPGTEDLLPYVPKKTSVRKWIGTLILFPGLAAIFAWIMSSL